MKNIFFYLLILFISLRLGAQSKKRNVLTGVPFLLITADARAAGLGDIGVASTPDSYSQLWNPSKYVFALENSAVSLNYTPYLSSLVNDIFLANLSYFKKLDDRSAVGASIKYFSLGDIQFNDFVGGNIIENGVERPNELALDISYSLKLNEYFSSSVSVRYIRSDLKLSVDPDLSSANSVAFDLGSFYRSRMYKLNNNAYRYRVGLSISNIGPRLQYSDNSRKDFLPTKFTLGGALDYFIDSNSALAFHMEVNKLLVPTSYVEVLNTDGTIDGYIQPDINFLEGIVTSFSDAPDGFQEELQEVFWSMGLEYIFKDNLKVRSGYFNESTEKGNRKYFTFGLGFKTINNIQMDFSYLASIVRIRNPLENSIRFSIAFEL